MAVRLLLERQSLPTILGQITTLVDELRVGPTQILVSYVQLAGRLLDLIGGLEKLLLGRVIVKIVTGVFVRHFI